MVRGLGEHTCEAVSTPKELVVKYWVCVKTKGVSLKRLNYVNVQADFIKIHKSLK